MASPPKPVKPSSRWNFLQQAVASVESKLDTILADEEDIPKNAPVVAQAGREKPPPRSSTDLSRSNSGTQQNDRLQERLARAMAKKSGSRPESPMPPTEPSSRATTPLPPLEVASMNKEDGQAILHLAPGDVQEAVTEEHEKQIPLPDVKTEETVAISQTDPYIETTTLQQPDKNVESLAPECISTPVHSTTLPSDDVEGRSTTATSGNLGADIREPVGVDSTPRSVQDEINGYIERIDALQAKLLYLTREVAASARFAAHEAGSGTAEKKLHEKDEKIALLMEEGQKLSKTEMRHSTTIKKLRGQVTSVTKESAESKVRAEQAERKLTAVEDRATRAELATQRAEENLSTSLDTSRDFEALRKERDALKLTVADMRGQVSRASSRAEEAESKAQSELLQKERKRTAQLQDDLASMKVEREVSEDRLKRDIGDLQSSLEREKEHSRAMESEMLNEQAVLESKLESFRARAEEASSIEHGDTQAKLLRQIETLQTQYSSASQNWQGIEGTLLTRVANLERERDEALTREGDARKRHREAALKSKQKDREVEDLSERVHDLDRKLAESQDGSQKAMRKAESLTDVLQQVRQELEDQRLQAEKELLRRLDEEKTKWVAVNSIARLDSPGPTSKKATAFDAGHLMSPVLFDRSHSRRSSTYHGLDSNTPPRQSSAVSFRNVSNGNMPETPSIITSMDEEYFSNVPPTPASQTHTMSNRGVKDIISTSTVGAGPSVQLVERMSATVRRLESEKAAGKDELARLGRQRDEARQEVVNLMREVDQKRTIDEKLEQLTEEHTALERRHQTTLELLGEKSEMVEELKADVTDVKQMYRELVDTLGRK